MSFILDALKKSDAERQRKSTPGFADIPLAANRHRPQRWVWVVGTLLAVNLAVLIIVLLRPQDTATELLPAPGSAAPARDTVSAPGDRTFSDYVAEAKRSRPEPSRATQVQPPAVTQVEPAPATATVPATARQSAGSSISEDYSTFNSLRADGTLQLPDLHLDIHVYSEQASDRFVFINMKKYKEQATLTEGPAVKEITPNGVVLEHAGTAFLLPRD